MCTGVKKCREIINQQLPQTINNVHDNSRRDTDRLKAAVNRVTLKNCQVKAVKDKA